MATEPITLRGQINREFRKNRNAAFVELIGAARKVVKNWETGNLAAAVNQLEEAANQAEELL